MKIGKNTATKEYHAAQREVEDALRRVRDANDVLADAHSALKAANYRLALAVRGSAVPSTDRDSPTAFSPGGSAPSQRHPE